MAVWAPVLLSSRTSWDFSLWSPSIRKCWRICRTNTLRHKSTQRRTAGRYPLRSGSISAKWRQTHCSKSCTSLNQCHESKIVKKWNIWSQLLIYLSFHLNLKAEFEFEFTYLLWQNLCGDNERQWQNAEATDKHERWKARQWYPIDPRQIQSRKAEVRIGAQRGETDECTGRWKCQQGLSSNAINQIRWAIDAHNLNASNDDGRCVRIEIGSGCFENARRVVHHRKSTTE